MFLIILANFVVVLTYSLVEIISSKWNNDGILNLDLIQKVLTLVQDPPGNVKDYFSDFACRSVLKGNKMPSLFHFDEIISTREYVKTTTKFAKIIRNIRLYLFK
jgi:hypothetical protein